LRLWTLAAPPTDLAAPRSAPTAAQQSAAGRDAAVKTTVVPTFRLVRRHRNIEVQHGTRRVPVAHTDAVGHAGDCAVAAYTPFNVYGNNYSTTYWRPHASMDCPLHYESELETCMAQLVTGGWETINTYVGEPACGVTGVNTWTDFNLESVNIDLTVGRWYSTWAWCFNFGFDEGLILEPADTPGVRVTG
jgi:hypothetical protein